MSALIAGLAGSLVSLPCNRLRHDGIKVRGLDKDITRPTRAAVAGALDVIFNMAYPTSPLASQFESLHYHDENRTLHTKPLDYSKGFVKRTADNDDRVSRPFRPMSIVVDCIK